MVKGGCLCGAVRYSIAGAPLVQLYCYCTDCRQVSGTDGYAPTWCNALTLLSTKVSR